ncbi:hypothetical protein BGY98DRAFT_1099119 [Russula aff. rugulosa BPL654]|nr:hypothetical protein BGY98DRAFT_1099119 [Russula aff. rugulosa BPL654]
MSMCGVWQRCDALATGGDPGSASSAHVLTHLISAHKNLVTSRPACSASLRRCTEWGYLRATFNRTHGYHSSGSVAGMVATVVSGRCRRHWDDWYRSSLEGAHCSDESAMLDKADTPLIRTRTYISSASNTSSHSPTASQGIASISTHRRGPKPAHGFNRAPSPHWATNCARDAERRLAAHLVTLIPLYHPLRPPLGSRRPADARLPHRVPHAHVARSLLPPPRPHSHVAALGELQHASSALRLSVSIEGLTLGLAGAGAAPQPPDFSA